MMRYSYFPGCSMDSTGITYKKSIEYVAAKIGMDLREIPDWNCCGATAAHCKDEKLAIALPARNLALAEKEGLELDMAVPCAACYSRMKHTMYAARKSEDTRQEIEEMIEMPYQASAEVLSFLEIFNQKEEREACKKKMVRTLQGLKVACYYGCLTTRPKGVIAGEDPENPMQMDNIVSLTGAEPVAWAYKTECCGASHQVDAPDAARPLVERILRNAKANGAQAIVTACPLCNLNLDMRESEVKDGKEAYNIPIYQFTQLLAVCMGAGAKQVGIHKHFQPAFELLNQNLRKVGEVR